MGMNWYIPVAIVLANAAVIKKRITILQDIQNSLPCYRRRIASNYNHWNNPSKIAILKCYSSHDDEVEVSFLVVDVWTNIQLLVGSVVGDIDSTSLLDQRLQWKRRTWYPGVMQIYYLYLSNTMFILIQIFFFMICADLKCDSWRSLHSLFYKLILVLMKILRGY